MAPYWNQLGNVDAMIELAPDLERRIRSRMKKRLVAIRLEEWQIARAKEAAAKRGIPYQQLLREWITSGMRADPIDGNARRQRRKAAHG